MQKWQYLYVGFFGKSYALNGIEHKFERNETMFMILDRPGNEGWELVAVETTGGARVYHFKRPPP